MLMNIFINACNSFRITYMFDGEQRSSFLLLFFFFMKTSFPSIILLCVIMYHSANDKYLQPFMSFKRLKNLKTPYYIVI